MPNEWTNDMPGMRPRKVRKASKKAKKAAGQKSGGASRGTTVGMALIFGLPALAFFGSLGYCIWMEVAA